MASFWLDPQDEKKLLTTPVKETDINLEFVDIPMLHSYDEQSDLFFDALSEAENMDFFKTKAVKKFIDFKWPLVFKYTVRRLFIPFLIYMFTYVFYMSGVYINRDTSEFMTNVNYGCEGVLIMFSLYFCSIEISQLGEEGIKYMFSVWNYLDLVPPFFLLAFIPMELTGYFDIPENKPVEGSMQAVMSLFIWLKMLYFLRIFEKTGYLIMIIIEVIIDMKYFLLILLLTFFAFADSLY